MIDVLLTQLKVILRLEGLEKVVYEEIKYTVDVNKVYCWSIKL